MRTAFVIVAIVFGIVVLAAGIVSVVLGQSNSSTVAHRLEREKVSLRVFDENAPADAIVSNASEAREAADTISSHRRAMAPTYSDLLGGQRFDPTNPEHLRYAQAMNLENSLNLAALAFGLTTVLIYNGVVLIIIGITLIVLAVAMWLYHVRRSRAAPEV